MATQPTISSATSGSNAAAESTESLEDKDPQGTAENVVPDEKVCDEAEERANTGSDSTEVDNGVGMPHNMARESLLATFFHIFTFTNCSFSVALQDGPSHAALSLPLGVHSSFSSAPLVEGPWHPQCIDNPVENEIEGIVLIEDASCKERFCDTYTGIWEIMLDFCCLHWNVEGCHVYGLANSILCVP